jgi:ABC-type siderophore export system fused ATPase/permease subunit
LNELWWLIKNRFSELAADQYPQFRKYFYEVILPDLKQQGKTIRVVAN